ncbi:MAG: hypothetical protein L0H83_00340 [Salinisphaera sp.]|nr:hypothetical protein [Salinisphaera sp.]
MTRLFAPRLWLLAGLVLATSVSRAAEGPKYNVQALSEGYALLYRTLGRIDMLPNLLWVKFESDPVDALATAVNDQVGKAVDRLQAYADSHPGIDLADTGLPLVERQRRDNTVKTVLKELLTRSGGRFELYFLLVMANLLNQIRHIAQALHELDQDQAGKTLTHETHQRFDRQYQKTMALLQASYFCPPQ